MWIVRLALRRPYTFVVMSMMIVILGILAAFRMPTDIFPEIDIPVVSVIWSYAGISPEEMAEVVTIRCERSFTTSVNDIEHMESQSLPGLSIIKIFFHPNAKVEAAVAQLAAASQAVLHSLPTGMTPPSILRYNASSVPILQLSISSDTMSESSLYDYGYNFIRTQMATVQGASFPLPYGGRPRQIMVDIDLKSRNCPNEHIARTAVYYQHAGLCSSGSKATRAKGRGGNILPRLSDGTLSRDGGRATYSMRGRRPRRY